ncbi:MAG: LamG domain-containing protein, partial [Candidatus Diapherotrites archaeon]|nr:LamG domain-containing protein [Candidatus Diapherotrites archaeon]
ALVLDGNRDYVSTVFTSQDFNTWGNYSASVWFSTAKSYGGMENHIFGARADVNELPEALSLSVTQSGVLRCVAGSSDKNVSVTGSHKVISGIWHQGVCARNGGVLSLFVDGTLDASASGTIVANNDLNKWLIGSYSINSAAFEDFNGSIDEVKLFNRALSSTDVLLDYNRFLQSKYASRVFDLNSSLTSFLSMKINSGVDYNFNSQISSGEGLFDGNISGLWHFNDKNSSGYLLNTVTNTRTGILSGDANVNGVGLWDTNAVSFGGSSGSVLLSSDANTFLGDGNLSVSFWFKPLSDGKSCTSPKNCTTLIQSTGSDSNWGITLGNLSTSGGISSADWSSINWTQDGNYRQGLPDNNCYSGQSDINMCGNVLLYHMNESSGNISDYSGNANTGTATGLTYGTAGKIGTALTFGSNKYISVPTNPLLNIRDALTISFWIYLTSSHSNNGVLMKCSTAANCSNDQGSYTVILISSNTIMLRLNGQGNLYDTAATTTIPQNTWTHVAFTYNKVNPKVYLNGVLNNTGNYTEQINDTTGTPLKVGYYYSTSYPFYGSMDELAIYNRALSATEIASIYKRGVVDLNLQIRSCTTSDCSGVNFTGPGGLTTTYYNYANKPISLSDPNQYIQYKAFFSTTDTSAAKGTTPALLDINLVRSDGTITTDTSKADFDLGTDVNTTHTADGNVILLAVSSVYPLTGTFTSKIFDKGAGSTPDGNGYRIFFYNNTSSEQYVSAPYSLGKWSNIVAVRSGGKINLYLNSQLLGSTEDGGSTNLSYPLVIGGTSSTNGGYFNGLIEELALWRKGLSVTEVASLFRKGAVSVDANVYSCSDANCNSITGFLQLSNLRNNSGQSISTLASARYFKYSLGFSYLSRVFDSNSLGSFASAGVPFVSDVNIIYAN